MKSLIAVTLAILFLANCSTAQKHTTSRAVNSAVQDSENRIPRGLIKPGF